MEPFTSAGVPLAERTEGIEEAGVGSEVVPNAQEVLNFIAHKCFKVIDPSKPEELNGFVRYLKKRAQSSGPRCSFRKFDIDSTV